jgi:hypothetical protein
MNAQRAEEVLSMLDEHVGEMSEGARDEKKSASTKLVELALRHYDFGVSTLDEPYALPKRGRKVVQLLRGSRTSLRNVLARDYFALHRTAVPQQALADCLCVLEGFAHEADEVELYLRVARHDGALWLDIGDQTGRAICIAPSGWGVNESAPVLFKRTALNAALPDPVRGGSLDELWALFNVAVADRPLVAAWLVAALFNHIPHPVLSFFGEQGTGKSSAQRMVVKIFDPTPVPLRKPPRDAESWVTAAAGSWVVGLDNLSDVQPWLSDSICRAVTGDGDVRRRLYTDGEHAVFAFRRCIVLNSIDLGAVRGDLGERMLSITLDAIPENNRRSEEELLELWNERHPRILGALLDLTVEVMNELPSVALANKPRMADFARILVAIDRVLRTKGFEHYRARQAAIATDSLTADPLVVAISALGQFEGTAAELLAAVSVKIEKPPKDWPSSPRSVTQRLRRQAPVMRKAGWTVGDDDGHNKSKVTRWTIVAPREAGISDPPSPPYPRASSDGGLAGEAGQDCRPSQELDDNPPEQHPVRVSVRI